MRPNTAPATKTANPIDEDELLKRAHRAYEQRCAREGWIYSAPSNDSGMKKIAGKRHLRLVNTRGTLALYLVTSSGRLKFIPYEEWPASSRRG